MIWWLIFSSVVGQFDKLFFWDICWNSFQQRIWGLYWRNPFECQLNSLRRVTNLSSTYVNWFWRSKSVLVKKERPQGVFLTEDRFWPPKSVHLRPTMRTLIEIARRGGQLLKLRRGRLFLRCPKRRARWLGQLQV